MTRDEARRLLELGPVDRDTALDDFAFAVGYRLMTPAERRALRISVLYEMGEAAPATPELAVLWHEDRLIRGEREPTSTYDRWVLMKARDEAERPAFDEQFWSARRADLEHAGFEPKEARDVIASVRASLGNPTTGLEGDDNGNLEQAA
ncbi:hypothetical protein K3172_13355 [Qipengyuania sp. 6B39]|uniref:hypothetical protein n=1 Tax=Qipengyuania proteolytica TaxID=2867239 RepID=UPI001C8958B9|nr:hypothetical protein [Qipengyuania proteolytica]MBX7496845.1 hypothetical protein [Qipengyuania proteolytica]